MTSKEDIGDLMGSVLKEDKVLLWCDGLGKEPKEAEKNTCTCRAKTSMIDSSDSDDEAPPSKRSKKGDRDDKVQRCVEDLKEKHRQSAYTPIQYRIWAELLIGGVYRSTSEVPTHFTMFIRAGTGGAQKRKGNVVASVQAASTSTASLGTSPAKLIDNRSKCYKQLADLSSLKQSGLLSETEYASEREAIMSMLKKLDFMMPTWDIDTFVFV